MVTPDKNSNPNILASPPPIKIKRRPGKLLISNLIFSPYLVNMYYTPYKDPASKTFSGPL